MQIYLLREYSIIIMFHSSLTGPGCITKEIRDIVSWKTNQPEMQHRITILDLHSKEKTVSINVLGEEKGDIPLHGAEAKHPHAIVQDLTSRSVQGHAGLLQLGL